MESRIVLAVLGSVGVGKTCWIKKLRTSTFEPKYIATNGFERTELFRNGRSFEISEFSGQEKFSEYRDELNEADGIIVMVDFSNKLSARCAEKWIHEADSLGKPVVVVANKCDLAMRGKKWNAIEKLVLENEMDFIPISVKTGLNIANPLDYFS